jgi:hypothetical protein
MKRLSLLILACAVVACQSIDRQALVRRNNPVVTGFDPLSSVSVGNGGFAFTVDATGLQTFPERYRDGLCLGTQSDWGWHSFANPEGFRHEETLADYDFGRGRLEPYSVQGSALTPRGRAASDWYRVNPHRLHLGVLGLHFGQPTLPSDIVDAHQELDMWTGLISSSFTLDDCRWTVRTTCHPDLDLVSARIESEDRPAVALRFPYPTGKHADDACDWDSPEKHVTEVVRSDARSAVLRRTLDGTQYYVALSWEEEAALEEVAPHEFVLQAEGNRLSVSCLFSQDLPDAALPVAAETFAASERHWQQWWEEGAAVDFSHCADSRAAELERRVVLSQYLLAIQCAGDQPPQETGLTYNSWFGKFHLEMIWWHQSHFALWGHPEVLQRSLAWYETAAPGAREIAARQGFEGLRWMKMTDPWAGEAPSSVGSFLIWQQPHYIYLSELLWRADPRPEVLEEHAALVEGTAAFMADFATWNPEENRYTLNHVIPAQETLSASVTVNPPLELAYWLEGLEIAQQWRERRGLARNEKWDDIIGKLSPLAAQDGLYLAAESATDSYTNPRMFSDHMAVLGAYGMLPGGRLVDPDIMRNTLDWIWDNWNWDHTWGWDYPLTAMSAARLGDGERAVDALLMDKPTNTYLSQGHNWQSDRLRCYLPGNGGLLTAVAMMCAGWDGSEGRNPGFPKDWDVRWEGLMKIR